MSFNVNTVTVTGTSLLAAATAADKIVISGCDAFTDVYTLSQAQNVSTRVNSQFTTSTNVSMVGATDNHLVSRAVFEAGVTSGGSVHTVMLFGHKTSDPTHDYVLCVASSNEAFTLPSVTDVSTVFEVLFDMFYSVNNDSVTASTTSTYLTMAEYNLIRPRIVTAYKEGDSTQGDDQEIRGKKSFLSPTFISELASDGSYSDTKVSTRLVPSATNTYDLGTTQSRFKTLWSNAVESVSGMTTNLMLAKKFSAVVIRNNAPVWQQDSFTCADITLTTTDKNTSPERLDGSININTYSYTDDDDSKQVAAAITLNSFSKQVTVTGKFNAGDTTITSLNANQGTVSVLEISDKLSFASGVELPIPKNVNNVLTVPIGAIVPIWAMEYVISCGDDYSVTASNTIRCASFSQEGKLAQSTLFVPVGKYRVVVGGSGETTTSGCGIIAVRIE